MEKSECKSADGQYQIAKIEKKLAEEISKIGPFQFLFRWENLINDSSYSTLNEINDSVHDIASLESVLYHLANADMGDHIREAKALEITKSALHVLNMLLADTIENNISTTSSSFLDAAKIESLKTTRLEDRVALELKGKINAKLLISAQVDKLPRPGNVYLEFDKDRIVAHKKFIKDRIPIDKINKYVRTKEAKENNDVLSRLRGAERDKFLQNKTEEFLKKFEISTKTVFIEITPVCDHAQGTWKHHRIIPGFLLKYDYQDMLSGGKDVAFYVSEPVFLQQYSDIYILVLDFRGLITIALGTLSSAQPLFRVRLSLLFDIQHKAGTHFSRPGYISLP